MSLKRIEIPEDLYDTICFAEDVYGLPHQCLVAVARIESAFKVDARNPHSTAKGLFQFIDSTARMYGIDPMDPAQAAGAAALMAHQNSIYWDKHIPRCWNRAVIYLMHQQGPAGTAKLMQTAYEDRPLTGHQIKAMSLNLPKVAREKFRLMETDAAKAVYFMRLWREKFEDAMEAFVVS